MQDNHPQLERIEQLLREGNQLRADAVAMQREHLAMQRELMDGWRANLSKASQVNDQALAIQRGAKRMQAVVLPIIIVAIACVSYLLFSGVFR
jgi:t-SNARE complex subunit (syntaxin)